MNRILRETIDAELHEKIIKALSGYGSRKKLCDDTGIKDDEVSVMKLHKVALPATIAKLKEYLK